jgi:hypothetical protein
MKKLLVLIAIMAAVFTFGPGAHAATVLNNTDLDIIQCGPISPVIEIGAVIAENDIFCDNTLTVASDIKSFHADHIAVQDSLIVAAHSTGVLFNKHCCCANHSMLTMTRKTINAERVQVRHIGKIRPKRYTIIT